MVYDTALARDALSLAEKWDASRAEPDVSKLSFQESDVAAFNANQKSTPLPHAVSGTVTSADR